MRRFSIAALVAVALARLGRRVDVNARTDDGFQPHVELAELT